MVEWDKAHLGTQSRLKSLDQPGLWLTGIISIQTALRYSKIDPYSVQASQRKGLPYSVLCSVSSIVFTKPSSEDHYLTYEDVVDTDSRNRATKSFEANQESPPRTVGKSEN
jgi:hypothetical protein